MKQKMILSSLAVIQGKKNDCFSKSHVCIDVSISASQGRSLTLFFSSFHIYVLINIWILREKGKVG